MLETGIPEIQTFILSDTQEQQISYRLLSTDYEKMETGREAKNSDLSLLLVNLFQKENSLSFCSSIQQKLKKIIRAEQ